MGDAFLYMYFVALGTSLGVLTAAWLGFKYYVRYKLKGGIKIGRSNTR